MAMHAPAPVAVPISPSEPAPLQDRPRVVCLGGEWDHQYAPTMRNAIAFELSQLRVGAELVVDVTGVSFCDSRGVRAVVMLQAIAEDRGVRLRFVGARPAIVRVFAAARLGHLVTTSSSAR